ncbi:unnamed protein product [Cylindrotheca closterium]|uniref:Uncharacterized protein n=1 Tax=Cylindrotheca closterium TaxID=2856 RepID=A0AAD2CR63_9STRA|nr:unnamed protein product [Cylindrotheca closterium]
MLFEVATVVLCKIENVHLFQYGGKGGKWREYGSGPLRYKIILRSDPRFDSQRGKGQVTFHNSLTCAGGLNMLVIYNFPLVHKTTSKPNEVHFKARSAVIGTDYKSSIYGIRFASPEDAARFMWAHWVLQLASINPSIPSPLSVEATTTRAFMGMGQEEHEEQDVINRHLIISSLCQLASANRAVLSSEHPSFQWAEQRLFDADVNAGRLLHNATEVDAEAELDAEAKLDAEADDDSASVHNWESQDYFSLDSELK